MFVVKCFSFFKKQKAKSVTTACKLASTYKNLSHQIKAISLKVSAQRPLIKMALFLQAEA